MSEIEFVPEIRAFHTSDTNFILKTWLRSYRENLAKVPDDIYYTYQQKLVKRLCASETARVAVCCDSTSRDFIYGFCVAEALKTAQADEPLCVHFTFTKLLYRKQGLAKLLLQAHGWFPGRPMQTSHWTRMAWDLHKTRNLVHNPFLLMELGYVFERSTDAGQSASNDPFLQSPNAAGL